LLKKVLDFEDIQDTVKQNVLESLCNYYYDKKKGDEVICLAEKYEEYLNANSKFILGVTYFLNNGPKKDDGLIIIYKASQEGCKKAIKFVSQIMESYNEKTK